MTRHAALTVIGALVVAGCVDAERAGRAQLAVYAASSLTDAFGELERLFEKAHPEVDVATTFAGSQILRIQITEGAPADVFASADAQHMAALVKAGHVAQGQVFAHNELVVIVPLDNPARIDTFAQLTNARRLVLGTPGVPAGRYARQVLAAADSLVRPGFRDAVLRHLVSEEPNVRLTRSKVELGDADAAIVYRTDAADTKRVRKIPIPPSVNVRADYLIGLVVREGRSPLAQAWIETVLSTEGRAVLERHGFVVG